MVKVNKPNSLWLNELPPEDRFSNDLLIINLGLMIGESSLVLKAMMLYMDYHFSHAQLHLVDQIVYMSLIYTGKFEKLKIPFLVDPPNSSCASLYGVQYIERNKNMEFGTIISSDQKTISLAVHQYDLYKDIVLSLESFCPQNEYKVKTFIRHFHIFKRPHRIRIE